ncbi:MAG: TonB family protein [Chromatiales bacterium]|jgi:protein TonB
MPNYRYTSWSIATTASLLIHVSAAYYWQQTGAQLSAPNKTDTTQTISFALQPTSTVTVPEEIPPQPQPEEKPPEKPEEVKPEPPPEVKTALPQQPQPRPRKAKQPDKPKKPENIVSRPKPPPPQQMAEAPDSEAQPAPKILVKSSRLQSLREHYIAELLTHIDAHKFYPRKARRRGYEGIVELSLMVTEDGQIKNLSARHDNRTLQQTAIRVVRRAQPLPEPPAAISMPLSVEFGMEFRLTQ